MRVNDLLALMHVPRWAIVPHSRTQSVAEHTFAVLVIARELAEAVGIALTADDLWYIVHHDVDECRTGDISGPAKRIGHATVAERRVICPWVPDYEPDPAVKTIVKVADLIEAATYIHRWGAGPHSKRAVKGLAHQLQLTYAGCPVEVIDASTRLLSAIWMDEGR